MEEKAREHTGGIEEEKRNGLAGRSEIRVAQEGG